MPDPGSPHAVFLTDDQAVALLDLVRLGCLFSAVSVHPFSGVATLSVGGEALSGRPAKTVALVDPDGSIAYRAEAL